MGALRAELSAVLAEAQASVAASETDSDVFFALADQLRDLCWTMGSVTYCALEWQEPTDAKADVDKYLQAGDERLDPEQRERRRRLRRGRRNRRLWASSERAV